MLPSNDEMRQSAAHSLFVCLDLPAARCNVTPHLSDLCWCKMNVKAAV